MNKTFSVLFVSIIALALMMISCSDDQNPAKAYSTHVPGWMDTSSANFHGQAVAHDTLTYHGCARCHGQTFQGSATIPSCYTCHAAYPHRIGGDSAEVVTEHRALAASLNWQLEQCTPCHGANYDGGRAGVSCRECHTSPSGPASCTTCHGQPPVDDNTVPYGMAPGAAGGHEAMVVEKGYACEECHPAVTDLSHTGPLPAVIVFGPNAIANARGYESSYSHVGDANSGNGSCVVYCHSNGRGGPPNDPVPEYTTTYEFTCTSCHFIPPASPHPQIQTCDNCHSNVDPSSNYPDDIRFINPQLHVNGVVDF